MLLARAAPNDFIRDAAEWLRTASMPEALDFYESLYNTPGCTDDTLAELGRADRYFLLVHLLHRKDAIHPWLYARTREVEAAPDGYLDLWFREGYKSTVITFSGIIQEILRNPDISIGIFSHVKPVARKFLIQIKEELEKNEDLKALYPNVLWQKPKSESPRWSEEKGIVVKRASNPKEATVEAHGLVDGQPTGAHFLLRVYDDVVTRESVGTPDQVAKTISAWELSDNLGARGEDGRARAWHIGTRYHFNDPYQSMLDRKALIPRVYAATDNGRPDGKPVFFSQEVWEEKKLKQGPATIACQMLQNPAAGTEAMFSKDWIKVSDIRPGTLNVYIMCDPASSKKKGSDSTAIAVVGVDAARNKYFLDGYRHKMNLAERWQALYGLRKFWMSQPGVQGVFVGYERYGSLSDLEYFEERMAATSDSFTITELAWPAEGSGSKIDRIQRLVPDFLQGRIYLPYEGKDETTNQRRLREEGQGFRIFKPTRRRDHEGNLYTLHHTLLTEFLVYPFSVHDDMLDALSRIYDMDYQVPVIIDARALEPECFADGV